MKPIARESASGTSACNPRRDDIEQRSFESLRHVPFV